ncbi:hypothetical protein BWQ96_04939 [Gracilariopsis chorda]|uniref:Uncharacterized protein n=1 Tax=Gracilariopsis chorda TaxID=448386 RepID=A0A2V3IT43_9FLOR|nr:hypothetical protein BWQ96_04939 [Gracilariopsis chorda]|eukprot:PXF45298.1 hypothetical protein BWQ96_04939 [Gracilariopsis chorda]
MGPLRTRSAKFMRYPAIPNKNKKVGTSVIKGLRQASVSGLLAVLQSTYGIHEGQAQDSCDLPQHAACDRSGVAIG